MSEVDNDRIRQYLEWSREDKIKESLKIKECLQQNPDRDSAAKLHFQRGLLFLSDRQYIQALSDLDKSISFEPRNYGAWFNRANILSQLDRYEEALTSLDRAIDINPDRDGVWSFRAIVLTCIIHEDLQKSSNPLLKLTYNDWLQKQSVFWGVITIRLSRVGE